MATFGAPGPPGAPGRLKRVLVWLRRDLRVEDHPALAAAVALAEEVVPVFIWAPEEEGQFQPGRCLRWWLHSSLRALEADFAALGSRIVYAKAAESRIALLQLVRDLGAQGVLFNHLYDPISMVRDNEVKAALAAAGVFCQSFSADILREPWEVLDPQGRPFTSFESFWTAHCGLPYPPARPLPTPAALPPVPPDVRGLELGELGMMLPEEEMSNVQLEYHWTPGGAGAYEVLAGFLQQRLKAFDRDRCKTDRNSTSRLSPHIHCGEVSIRTVYWLAKQKEAEWAQQGEGGSSVADFLRQVGYREYSRYLSFHFPFTHERSLLEHLRAVPWKFDQRLFKAWRQGRTGYPLVDAGMRELWSTGWFHNRIRVVCASFLVKHLLLPWQWGLKHYWDAQLDADLESDALGWQYCAGCMADAHEFSYMMDLCAESKRFDPDGNYVRRWLPVLARLPAKYIHAPWEAPERVLDDAGVELGINYPLPVISEDEARADLAKANAYVLACQRGEEGAGEAGVPDYGAAIGVPAGAGGGGSTFTSSLLAAGPFRPPTEPPPPGLAERLWGVSMVGGPAGGGGALRVGGGGRRRPLEESSDALEEVQSNAVAMDEVSEIRGWVPAAAGAAAPAAEEAAVEPRAAVRAAPWPPKVWEGPEAWPASLGAPAGGHLSSGDGTGKGTGTGFALPSTTPSTVGLAHQISTEAAEHGASVQGPGAFSPLDAPHSTAGAPAGGSCCYVGASGRRPPAARGSPPAVAKGQGEQGPSPLPPQSKRPRPAETAARPPLVAPTPAGAEGEAAR